MNQKPEAVIPENLSEMSPQSAWNLALNTIAPLADWNSFWNDGLETTSDIHRLIIKEKTDGQRKFRYRGSPRRLGTRQQGLYSWRRRHTSLREGEARTQLSTHASTKEDQEVVYLRPDLAGR